MRNAYAVQLQKIKLGKSKSKGIFFQFNIKNYLNKSWCYYTSHSFIIHLLINIYSVLGMEMNKTWIILSLNVYSIQRYGTASHYAVEYSLVVERSTKSSFDTLWAVNALTHLICPPSQVYIRGCSIFK